MSDKTRDVAMMFDRISRTYDFLNHLLSFGIDSRWRRRAVGELNATDGMTILDCGAGTGDMALALHNTQPRVSTVLLDPARAMLSIADGKADSIKPPDFVLVQGSAENLPFQDESFDGFMVAFGVRNFADLSRGLSELSRTLRSGGRGVILEFTPDRACGFNAVFRWYMTRILQPLASVVSRDRDAYAYLARTVETFHTSLELITQLESAGLLLERQNSLTFGIARLFVVQKPH